MLEGSVVWGVHWMIRPVAKHALHASTSNRCGQMARRRWERGKECAHVKTPNDRHYLRLKAPEEVIVSLKTSSNLDDTYREELVEMLGGNAVILMDFITFDKNMRLVDQISTIDGWNFEIKYINYDIPRPVKRQRTL